MTNVSPERYIKGWASTTLENRTALSYTDYASELFRTLPRHSKQSTARKSLKISKTVKMVGIARPQGTLYEFKQQDITIDEHFASKEQYRATSHDLPTPLPCTTKKPHQALSKMLKNEVVPRLPEIMTRHGISYISTEIEVAQYFQRHEDPTGRYTVTIPVTGEGCASWKAAAKEVRDLCGKFGADEYVEDLQVEIQNEERMYCDISWTVWDSDIISAIWKVRDDILNAVKGMMGNDWTSIAYHLRVDHRKTSRVYEGEPGKNTIIVFCRPGSRANFVHAESQIVELLKNIPYDIHVEFLPGEIVSTASDEAPGVPEALESPISDDPENGASIGVRDGGHQIGSLGGWFILDLKGHQVQCALTAYSAVRSTDKTVARRTDAFGIQPRDPYGHEDVEYPAAYDVEYSLDVVENRLEPEQLKYDPEYCALQRRRADPSIGKVIVASGYRRIVDTQDGQQMRLDWALIESPDTFKANLVVPSRELKTSSQFVELSFMDYMDYSAPRGARTQGASGLESMVVVAKCGRTTGKTWGYANPLPRDINRGSYHTSECEMMSPVNHFAAYGDAGSLVHNSDREIVGMLAAADRNPFGFNSGFLTYFTEIARDVERLTGGTLTPAIPGKIPVKNDTVDQSLGESIKPGRYRRTQQPARETELSLFDEDDDDERRTVQLRMKM